jgi:hypothetical protein
MGRCIEIPAAIKRTCSCRGCVERSCCLLYIENYSQKTRMFKTTCSTRTQESSEAWRRCLGARGRSRWHGAIVLVQTESASWRCCDVHRQPSKKPKQRNRVLAASLAGSIYTPSQLDVLNVRWQMRGSSRRGSHNGPKSSYPHFSPLGEAYIQHDSIISEQPTWPLGRKDFG